MGRKKQFIVSDEQPVESADALARRTGQVVQCMKRFFARKPYYKTGEVIAGDILISKTNIDIVLNAVDFNEAMAMAQDAVEKHKLEGRWFVKSRCYMDDARETRLYMNFIEECRALEIPYSSQGGMLLLYLWLCEGVEF